MPRMLRPCRATVPTAIAVGLMLSLANCSPEPPNFPTAVSTFRPTVVDRPAIECSAIGAALDSLFVDAHGQLAIADSAVVQFTIASDSEHPLDSALAIDAGVRRWLADSLQLDESAIVDFERQNAHPSLACFGPATRHVFTIVSSRDLASLRQHREPFGYWKAFRHRFPGSYGLVDLSHAGLSADGQQAMLTIGNGCGDLCGSGWMVALRPDTAGHWRVYRMIMLWIS